MSGWIKLHRQLLDHPRSGDPDWISVWVHLMLRATHQPLQKVFDGELITLQPGQLITSRNTLEAKSGVNRSKIDRVLRVMETEHQIEQRSGSTSRLVTILNWLDFQDNEPPSEPQVSRDRATSEPRVSTNKKGRIEEDKKGEALSLLPLVDAAIAPASKKQSGEHRNAAVLLLTYLNEKASRNFSTVPEMTKPIIRRLVEGNSVDEIKKMIDREIALQGPSSKWLQPSTLFGKNFYGAFSDRNLSHANNGKINPKNDRNLGFAPGQDARAAAIAAAARRQNEKPTEN